MLRVENATYYPFGSNGPTARVLIGPQEGRFSANDKTFPFILVLEVPADEARAMEEGDIEAFQKYLKNVDDNSYEIQARKAYLAEPVGTTALFGAQSSDSSPDVIPTRTKYRLKEIDDGQVSIDHEPSNPGVKPVRPMDDPGIYN
jgi:hypothetical protein